MRFITRRAHGVLDYLVGLALLFAPAIFGLAEGAESRVPVILGIATLIYSAFTDYELGIFKLLSFRAHLTLDVMSGVLLALSPWLFQFYESTWAPHLVVGLVELGAVLMTRPGAPVASGPTLTPRM